jgi:hypothetical protein
MRAWRHYAECGFVGMYALAWQSSMIPVCRGSATVMPAFPALEEVVKQAECVRLQRGSESTNEREYC